MSKFSGRQGKGASRAHQEKKRVEAEARAARKIVATCLPCGRDVREGGSLCCPQPIDGAA
jgi:hypothetical protein